LRLFACACLRHIWLQWGKAKVPEEVEISERFADGKIDKRILNEVRSRLGARGGISAAWAANCASHAVLCDQPDVAAERALTSAAHFAFHLVYEATFSKSEFVGDTEKALAAQQVDSNKIVELFRDIFGNPFRSITINSAWLAWRDGAIVRIAQHIYDDRAFADLPELADALEEAGCTNAELLAHCRQPGPHVRGCWSVDLILGKT
jgi:hypothetical protein